VVGKNITEQRDKEVCIGVIGIESIGKDQGTEISFVDRDRGQWKECTDRSDGHDVRRICGNNEDDSVHRRIVIGRCANTIVGKTGQEAVHKLARGRGCEFRQSERGIIKTDDGERQVGSEAFVWETI
jgi:hypothetical protein